MTHAGSTRPLRDLVVATRNHAKLREIQLVLTGLSVTLRPLDEVPGCPSVVEDGRTFCANAVKKATEIARVTGCLTLADDSGLEVDALAGAPGVHSARYAGPQATDSENNAKLLRELAGVPPAGRGARFVCCLAIADPGGLLGTAEGVCAGFITEAPRGSAGFGYDPLFLLPTYQRTFGELGLEVKNRLSHRAQALAKAAGLLRAHLSTNTPGRAEAGA